MGDANKMYKTSLSFMSHLLIFTEPLGIKIQEHRFANNGSLIAMSIYM